MKDNKTTTKRIVWLCLLNGMAWVWCSYLLAALGRLEIAQSLSKTAITEIIGVVLVYCLKALFENLNKYRRKDINDDVCEENGADGQGV